MICRDSACTWPIRHYHTDYRDERCPGDFVQGHRCVCEPACVDPRTGYALVVPDAAPVRADGQQRIDWDGEEWVRAIEWQGLHERLCRAETAPDAAPRTLRIEVTDDDVAAGLDTWAAKKSAFQRPLRLRAVLDVFACRLADRHWDEVPAKATIPAGMPTRVEGYYYSHGGPWAHERVLDVAFPPDARLMDCTYFVPADRVGELVMPEPDLATRVHDRMRASFEADGLTIEGVRAALAAEGVEG